MCICINIACVTMETGVYSIKAACFLSLAAVGFRTTPDVNNNHNDNKYNNHRNNNYNSYYILFF